MLEIRASEIHGAYKPLQEGEKRELNIVAFNECMALFSYDGLSRKRIMDKAASKEPFICTYPKPEHRINSLQQLPININLCKLPGAAWEVLLPWL